MGKRGRMINTSDLIGEEMIIKDKKFILYEIIKQIMNNPKLIKKFLIENYTYGLKVAIEKTKNKVDMDLSVSKSSLYFDIDLSVRKSPLYYSQFDIVPHYLNPLRKDVIEIDNFSKKSSGTFILSRYDK